MKEQACYVACTEKCTEELCPKCLLVLWTSKNSHLSHSQNNLSQNSGHRVFSHTADEIVYFVSSAGEEK